LANYTCLCLRYGHLEDPHSRKAHPHCKAVHHLGIEDLTLSLVALTPRITPDTQAVINYVHLDLCGKVIGS